MKIQYQSNGITVFESGLYRTTSTVIDMGYSIIIVDPNWLLEEVHFIKNYIDKFHSGKYQYLLFTHSDYDHIIGYGLFPNANVIASSEFVGNSRKQDILQQIKDFDYQYYIERDYPILYPTVDIVVTDDKQTIEIDNKKCIFYKANGHVKDGIFVIIPSMRCWVGGDYLSNIEIPMIDDQYNNYVNTMYKSQQLTSEYTEIQLYIPGHGDCAHTMTSIKSRIKKDLLYLKLLKQTNVQLEEGEILSLIYSYSSNPEMIKIHNNNLSKL